MSQTTQNTKFIPLHHEWTFYFEKSILQSKPEKTESVQCMGSFDTVQGFWGYWNNIQINKLPQSFQLRLFKSPINPSTDDPVSVNGGKLIVCYHKCENISQEWLVCLLALIGEQFTASDEICGSVLSLGATRNTISLWTKTHKKEFLEPLQDELCQFLRVARDKIRFQRHIDPEKKSCKSFSIRLRSVNYRNLDLNHLPLVTVSPSLDCDEYSTPFIDLINPPIMSSQSLPTQLKPMNRTSNEIPITRNRHRKSLSEEILSSEKKGDMESNSLCCSNRLAFSIDASSFRRWQNVEMSTKPSYHLPKIHRRRGRKCLAPVPRRRRVLAVPISVPPTIPEDKEFHIEVPPEKRTKSDKCLGIRISYWIAFLGLIATLLIGTYFYGIYFVGGESMVL